MRRMLVSAAGAVQITAQTVRLVHLPPAVIQACS